MELCGAGDHEVTGCSAGVCFAIIINGKTESFFIQQPFNPNDTHRSYIKALRLQIQALKNSGNDRIVVAHAESCVENSTGAGSMMDAVGMWRVS